MCLRHFDRPLADVVLAFCIVMLILSPSSAVAQDDESEGIYGQEVIAFYGTIVDPADPARDKDAPVEFLKPLINSEISFIKRVCEPSDEQMTAIIAAATLAYNATGDMVTDPDHPNGVGNYFRYLGSGSELINQNPYHRVRRDAATYLQPIITTEQYSRYQTESNQRDQFERGAIAGLYVRLINDKVPMTEQQQSEMRDLMMGKLGDLDIKSLDVYRDSPKFIPYLPAEVVDKVFTKKQFALWKSINAGQISFWTSVGSNSEMSVAEEWVK